MGQMAQKISDLDKKQLLDMLNMAFAEEWLAYYQYWVGTQVARGPMRSTIIEEMMTHAKEELAHAQLLSDRIIQLGGTPLLDPSEWAKHAKCKYEAPKDDKICAILQQNLNGERCAIARYQQICDFTRGKDLQTFHISRHILSEELEHEQDLEDFMDDIKIAMSGECK